ncbi:diol dehydratase small subunit [Lactobacillus sp. XV13L]|nr:diol dehydratase small subunit [Lactobacillus sp. XV13L]
MSEVDDLVSKIMKKMGNAVDEKPSSNDSKELNANDYPLYSKHPELVHSPSGKNLDEISVDNVLSGKIGSHDLRITPETLKLQGEIAANAGRPAIQRNFQRASELTAIPDERVLQMYNALRPYRSTKQDLLDIAEELRTKYHANVCADWFKEAAEYYESRKKLKGDN